MHKQTLGEMETERQVVSGIFKPKIIKIWQLVFKSQSKMLGMFFLAHSVVYLLTS